MTNVQMCSFVQPMKSNFLLDLMALTESQLMVKCLKTQHTGLLHTSLISIFLWHQDHLPKCWKILSKSYTFKTQGRCWL